MAETIHGAGHLVCFQKNRFFDGPGENVHSGAMLDFLGNVKRTGKIFVSRNQSVIGQNDCLSIFHGFKRVLSQFHCTIGGIFGAAHIGSASATR